MPESSIQPAMGPLTAALRDARARGELALIASLPVNEAEYVTAARRGGAHAVKLHFGLTHRASGRRLPTLEEQADLALRLRDLVPDLPLGAVLGDTSETVDRALDLAADLGLDFISAYAHALPARAFGLGFEVLVALDDRSPPGWAARLPAGALLEASVVPHAEYGTPLTAADLLRYADLRARTPAPLVIPTQKHIRPADLPALRQLGADALMYGVVVAGEGADGFETAAHRFRGA